VVDTHKKPPLKGVLVIGFFNRKTKRDDCVKYIEQTACQTGKWFFIGVLSVILGGNGN
jgi:hypothetical protein